MFLSEDGSLVAVRVGVLSSRMVEDGVASIIVAFLDFVGVTRPDCPFGLFTVAMDFC